MAYLALFFAAIGDGLKTAAELGGSALDGVIKWGLELLAGLVAVLLGLGIALAPHADRYLLGAGIAGLVGLTIALTKKYL